MKAEKIEIFEKVIGTGLFATTNKPDDTLKIAYLRGSIYSLFFINDDNGDDELWSWVEGGNFISFEEVLENVSEEIAEELLFHMELFI